MEEDPQTWRELLKQIVEDPRAKERILEETRVQPITLTRWLQGTSKPRDDAMRTLLRIIPYPLYKTFIALIAEDFPQLASAPTRNELAQPDPPVEFYIRMLHAYATTISTLYPQSLRDLLLQQMIKHFDPARLGMAISIARCMPPPPGQKVRCLHVITGIGTSPWEGDLSQRPMFLGAESLAGAAVSNSRLAGVPNRDDDHMNPAHWIENEQCAIAYPIMCKTRIAGALIVVGAQPHMFSEAHQFLLENYANMLSLTFDQELFYESREISLRLMPQYHLQKPALKRLRERYIQKMTQAPLHQALTLDEAQELVWHEMEEELLAMATMEIRRQPSRQE